MAIDVLRQEILLRAGDTETIRFTIQDDVDPENGGPNKYPLTVNDQFKFSMKLHATLVHEMMFKTSYRAGDLDLSDISNSHVSILVTPDDLHLATRGTYVWEFEMFRPGAFGPGAGSISVQAGGSDVLGSGTIFLTQLRPGMVLQVGGFYTVVRTVVDDTHATVDPGSWPTLSGQAFTVAEKMFCKTVAGGYVDLLSELVI